MKSIISSIRKCKKHKIVNCPNPKCNPTNKANEVIKNVNRKIEKLKLKKIKKPDDTKDS